MLHGGDLYGIRSKYDAAIERIRMFEPADGYFIAFSGGKDSQCVLHLAEEAGVKYDAHYHLTTVDPPELVKFIKQHYPDVAIEHPPMTMWQLIEKKRMPPTHKARYCCDVLKEGGGKGRTVITGVRWAESVSRRKKRSVLELNAYSNHKIRLNNDNDEARRMYEACVMKNRHILNPIVDWTDEEVWEYLDGNGIQHCSLYDEGFKRLGCIGCPLAGSKNMIREFERWPKYKDAYLRAFDKMLISNAEDGVKCKWPDAQAVMDWWLRSDEDDDRGGGQAVHTLENFEGGGLT